MLKRSAEVACALRTLSNSRGMFAFVKSLKSTSAPSSVSTSMVFPVHRCDGACQGMNHLLGGCRDGGERKTSNEQAECSKPFEHWHASFSSAEFRLSKSVDVAVESEKYSSSFGLAVEEGSTGRFISGSVPGHNASDFLQMAASMANPFPHASRLGHPPTFAASAKKKVAPLSTSALAQISPRAS